MKTKTVLLWCAGSIVLCGGIWGVALLVNQKRTGDSLTAEIAQAKSDGLATTIPDFAKPIDRKVNALPGLLAAAESIKKSEELRLKAEARPGKPKPDFLDKALDRRF